MYQCTHFQIHELVSEDVFNARGQKAWELFDYRALITLDRLRERYGRMTVNNWKWGGDRCWSGLRNPTSPWFSQFSQHTFGRAFDIIFEGVTAEQVRQDILANPNDPCFEFIGSIELGTSWLHFDVRNCSRIKTYTP